MPCNFFLLFNIKLKSVLILVLLDHFLMSFLKHMLMKRYKGQLSQVHKRSQLPWRTVWRFLKKLEIELPYDPAIPLLGIYPEKTIIKK